MMAEAPPTPPPPERQFLTTLAGTSLYLSSTDEPWRIPADAFVLPMGPRAGMNGQLARAYRSALGPSEEGLLRQVVRERIKEQRKAEQLQPEEPVLVDLPGEISWPQLQEEPDFTQKYTPPSRFLIAATAYGESAAAVHGAASATKALLRLAANAGIRAIVLPSLGTGQGELPSSEVVRAMIGEIQAFLLGASPSDRSLREITLIIRDELGIKAAFDFFNRRAQRLLNDLPRGDDLLNIAIEARALAETLLLRDLTPPLSVAIIGGWGSGKSFIMHLMQERMAEIRTQKLQAAQTWPAPHDGTKGDALFPYVGHIYQIKFDAWTYAKGDLWSSLMQTIFFELNRQISLEKRLREAFTSEPGKQDQGAAFLLDGGPGWRALNELNDELRDQLIQADFEKTYLKWKQQTAATLDDVLWQELKLLKQEERVKLEKALEAKQTEIQSAEATLLAKQDQLADTNSTLNQLREQDPAQQAQEEALQALPGDALARLGANVMSQLEWQLKAATTANGQVGTINKEAIKPNTTRIFMDEVLQDPGKLRWFFLLVWLGAAAFLLSALAQTLIPQVVGAVVALGSFLAAGWRHVSPWLSQVLGALKAWDQAVEETYQRYKQEVERRYQVLLVEKNEKIGAQQKEKAKLEGEIAESQGKLAALKEELERQRRRISPLASYDTLLEFVTSRLSDTYEKKLGFVHLVQRDLRELTESLVTDLDKPERIPERLRDLFPRGPARIVLFIDDLDRCPPDQVVQVLEAAQLLLKTELFVVVLAIDVRYVARALEKAYDRILVRRGSPSGLDYIEKIIQIPYKVRSIDPDALENYLRAQMQIEEQADRREPFASNIGTSGGSYQEDAATVERTVSEASPLEAPPSEVLKFSQSDLDKLLGCCRLVDLSPRAIKRLINVSKIIKIVWFRSRIEPAEDTVRGVFGLLALSDRFPDLMRGLFEEISNYLRLPGANQNKPFRELMQQFPPNGMTFQQKRDWEHLLKVIQNEDLLPSGLTPAQFGLVSFNLVRSFCFVGDIGYDPREEDRAKTDLDVPNSTLQ